MHWLQLGAFICASGGGISVQHLGPSAVCGVCSPMAIVTHLGWDVMIGAKTSGAVGVLWINQASLGVGFSVLVFIVDSNRDRGEC